MTVIDDMAKIQSFIEIDGIRIYPPKDYLPVIGKDKDEDGNEVMVVSFTYQEPYKATFKYTAPDGTVTESTEG